MRTAWTDRAVADWPRASRQKSSATTLVKNTPIWWEDAPPVSVAPKPVAPSCDVAIVGAGYTGLSAAITLARAGRQVQVFDKLRAGEGASSRNGGIASGNLRPPLSQMIRRFGKERAIAMQAEAKAAREDLVQFIAQEGIDCDFKLTGRFAGASSPDQYDKLRREAEALSRSLGIEAFALERARQRDALGTDYYWGGMVRMDIGGLHPAKLLAGMLRLAQAAGADHPRRDGRCAHRAGGRRLRGRDRASGKVRARDVIVATNGYTDAANPWLRRRLVPVASCIIATEPISANLMRTLMPKGYMCAETRKLHYYYRPSPDGRRILFGGRGGSLGDASAAATPRLKRALVDIFPELDGTGVTPQLVRLRRHEPRHGPPHLLPRRHPLRGRLLRVRRGVGALGRPEGRAQRARRQADALGARFSPAARDTPLRRQALVHARSLCLVRAPRPPRRPPPVTSVPPSPRLRG